MRITYIGHATLLIEVAGVRILTDPNFDEALGRFLPRVSRPGVPIDALGKLDAMLLTHAHADHLSFASLDALPRDIPLFAPPAVERWLRKRGYEHAEALPPGSNLTVGAVRIHAASAKHMGARYAVDRWRSAANMYLLDTGSLTCFFAGDTALTPDSDRMVHDALTEQGRALDIAMLPIGHAPWWKPGFRSGHLSSDDALELFVRLGARFMIPYHWGTFQHLTSGPYQAIERLKGLLGAHVRRDHVKIIEPGQAFDLPIEHERAEGQGPRAEGRV
jgi:L-ascorbate metabolism protein UlaG (beta-lactamase superfamily)